MHTEQRNPRVIESLVVFLSLLIAVDVHGDSVSATWTCLSDDWVVTSCWDDLGLGDTYPDDVQGNVYSVILPSATYTVSIESIDPEISIDELEMAGTGTTLEIGSGHSLSVQSALTSHGMLSVFGSLAGDAGAIVNIDESDLNAYDGAVIDLPAVSYVGSSSCFGETIHAQDTGLIILDELTSIDGSTCGGVTLRATNGGMIDLSGLTSSINSMTYKADGEDSLLLLDQMSALSNCTLTALNGGAVMAAPFASLHNVAVTIGGPTSVLDLSAVEDINESDVTAQDGAVVSLPLISSITGSVSCSGELLRARDPGSVLDLTTVTSIDGSTCGGVSVEALDGGFVDLSNLASSSNSVTYKASGADSELRIDLMDALQAGSVTVTGGGTIVAAPLTALEDVYVTVSGPTSTLDLSQVVTINESDLIVQDGAVVAIPQVTSIVGSSYCGSETLKATDTGSVLDLTSVTSLDGSICGAVVVTADSGGLVDISELPVSQNQVTYQATGVGSTIRIDLLDELLAGAVTVAGGGTIVAAPFTALEDVIVTVGGPTSTLDLSQVVTIDNSDVTVKDGAVVSLPMLTGIIGSGSCSFEILKATGTGSVLDLTTITSLDGSTCGAVVVTAESGGLVDLSALPLSQNDVVYQATGAGSTLRIDLLDQLLAGSVTVTGGGTIVAAPFTILQDLTLTVGGATSTLDLSQVTSMDRSNVTVQDGATVALPLLTSYTKNDDCGFKILKSTGPGSMLDLSSVVSMNGQTCGRIILQAFSDGVIDLSSLTDSGGNLAIEVSGESSALFAGGLLLASGGEIDVSEGLIELTGPLSYEITSPEAFVWTEGATLSMLGGDLKACQGLEVAGKDYGDDPKGYIENFQLDRLVIGAGAQIDLVDHIDNGSVGGVGGCHEAIYVDTLEFGDADGRLLTNGLHIYYHTLIGEASQIITDVNCVFGDPPSCDGDANGDRTVDPLDSGFVLSRFGCAVGTCILECDAADQNHDGLVDPLDVGFVLARFGSCP